MNVSIIIVEYLDVEILRGAIESIYKHAGGLNFEIIIISNSGYSEKEQKKISSSFPDDVYFIYNQDNLGFARAVNQGIKQSRGEWILLLNPDARLLNDKLSEAIKFAEQHPYIAIVGPQVQDSTKKIQDSARKFITLKTLLRRTTKRFLYSEQSLSIQEDSNYTEPHPVDWVSGLCMLVRRKAIEKVGLMDERYFIYVEDMDWCRRFWQAGYEVWYWPHWIVQHDARRASVRSFSLTNKMMWIHIISLIKYTLKWKFKIKV